MTPQTKKTRHRSSRKNIHKSRRTIAYQNKDIASKVIADALIGRNLAPFGLPHIKIIDALPTNLPAIESNELRLDNLFLLSDGTLAIIDYESSYSKEIFVKYLNYAARVVKRYAKQKRLEELKELKIIVIYTADVEHTCQIYDLRGITVRIEPAYLVGMDTDSIFKKLESKINSGQPLNDDEQMQFMVLPLTVKGNANKQDVIRSSVALAKRIPDPQQQREVLTGILTFTDKVIDDRCRLDVKGVLEMTQIQKMFYDEISEQVWNEAWGKAWEESQFASVKNLMENQGCTAKQAMDALDIPLENRESYLEKLSERKASAS